MGFRIWGLGFRIWGLGFGGQGLGFEGVGVKVLDSNGSRHRNSKVDMPKQYILYAYMGSCTDAL